ncbi:MAG: serine/threonine protein kinase [Myxococcales bacterium]|nr:serine/threonine protein kinase [Myxococcales bacterium]
MDVADDSQELLAALERGKPEMHDPVAQDILDEVRRAALGVGSTPRQFGRFTVLERVAGGGMGVVYAAFDPKLSRKVAIKVLRDQGDARRRRLLREARTLARLSHPNVVAIHDVEHEGDAVFIAMEFIEGDSLRRWLRQPRLLERVVDVLVDAGQGLAAAHAQGVVHGDFKPDNVLVGEDGRARVVDFGLARTIEAREPTGCVESMAAASGLSSRVGGTVMYMAPEQLAGGRPDERADQFSFAVTAYEALYGARPFSGETAGAILEEVRAGRVRAPPVGSHVGAALHRALLRALELDATRRFPSMRALLEELRVTPGSRRSRWFGVGLGVGLGLFGAASFLLGSVGSERISLMIFGSPVVVVQARVNEETGGRDAPTMLSLEDFPWEPGAMHGPLGGGIPAPIERFINVVDKAERYERAALTLTERDPARASLMRAEASRLRGDLDRRLAAQLRRAQRDAERDPEDSVFIAIAENTIELARARREELQTSRAPSEQRPTPDE